MTVDVVVLGGGPAGATSATLLAQAGFEVLVLEKERFPRFHIGESLLPRSLPILDKLGAPLNGTEYRYKGGAEFFDEATGDYALYPFADALPGGINPDHAYQVDRSRFDASLLDAAVRAGATVHQGEPAKDVVVEESRIIVRSDRSTYDARYCIDATGQDAFLAKRAKGVVPIKSFGRAAVYTHFEDLTGEGLRVLGPDGNIKVLMLPDGWAWLIPLAGGRLSVGLVSREGPVRQRLVDDFLATSPLTRSAVRGARRMQTHVVGNFSFRNVTPAGARHCSIGDAACFLDPVFSSGVAFAMVGAEAVSRALTRALERRTEASPNLMQPVDDYMQRAYGCVGALVYAFYHTQMIRNLFFAAKPNPRIRSGLISVLSGDIWREDNDFQKMLMRSTRRKF